MKEILCLLFEVAFVVLVARVVMSWFPVAPGSPFATIYGILYSVTEPVLGPIRRAIPPMGMGGMGLDLSPLIVFMALFFLQQAFCR